MTLKTSLITVLASGLVCGVCWADEPKTAADETGSEMELKSDNDKVLYSLGYELGKDISRQELELAPQMLLKGVEDGMSGGKPLINTRQRQAALKQIKEMREEGLEKQSKSASGLDSESESESECCCRRIHHN